mmetsp:Transcript_9442/g.20689  ORF Transcript_9442/g.20689 Transcript_9442/m.20689 type:complete len:209 (+) Transcript_9442:577-1203(+)
MTTAPAWCGSIMRAKSTWWLQPRSAAMDMCIRLLAFMNACVDVQVVLPQPIDMDPDMPGMSALWSEPWSALWSWSWSWSWPELWSIWAVVVIWPICPICDGQLAFSPRFLVASQSRMPVTSRSCSLFTCWQKCTSPSMPPSVAQDSSSRRTSHMATAPLWWGIMPRTKSRPASQVKLMAMPLCMSMFTLSQSLAAWGQAFPPQPMDMV